MLPNRAGSHPFPWLLIGLLLVEGLVSGCHGVPRAPRPPAVTPAAEARHRVRYLQGQGGTLTSDQIRMIEHLPFTASGPSDIPRALRDGIPRPNVPLGERRSLLELYGGVEHGAAARKAAASRTGEDESIDPQR